VRFVLSQSSFQIPSKVLLSHFARDDLVSRVEVWRY